MTDAATCAAEHDPPPPPGARPRAARGARAPVGHRAARGKAPVVGGGGRGSGERISARDGAGRKGWLPPVVLCSRIISLVPSLAH